MLGGAGEVAMSALHWGGLRATWKHTPRGGYGFTVDVPCTVVDSSKPSRVRIRVKTADGVEVERTVHSKNLRLTEALGKWP